MRNLKTLFVELLIGSLLVAGMSAAAWADTPTTRDDGVTVIHLDEYNGYFAAEETLASLRAGEYEFVVTNRADKLVGFQIQDLESRTNLDMFPLEPPASYWPAWRKQTCDRRLMPIGSRLSGAPLTTLPACLRRRRRRQRSWRTRRRTLTSGS